LKVALKSFLLLIRKAKKYCKGPIVLSDCKQFGSHEVRTRGDLGQDRLPFSLQVASQEQSRTSHGISLKIVFLIRILYTRILI